MILSIHSELGDAIIKKRSCWSREEEGGVHWFERKGEQRSWPQSRTVSLLLITSNSWEKRHSSAPRALCACFPASQTPPQPSHFAAPLKHTLSPLSLPHLMMFLRKKKWNFHLHQHSSIAHEYFRGMWVVCHGPRLDCISTLSWSSSNDGRAEQAKTNPPSHHHQHPRIWSGAVNHLVDGRTLDARRRGVIAVLLQDIQNDSYM